MATSASSKAKTTPATHTGQEDPISSIIRGHMVTSRPHLVTTCLSSTNITKSRPLPATVISLTILKNPNTS
jgi:hypothetical protein